MIVFAVPTPSTHSMALVLDPIWPAAAQLFGEHGIETLEPAHEASAQRIDFVILRSGSTLPAERLALLREKGLRAVLRAGSGLDNIDLGYCGTHGIEVTNFPGRNADSVAEVTLSYMLSAAHRLYPASADMRRGIFSKDKYLGRNLASVTIAFVGYGATAHATIALLRRIGVTDIMACRKSHVTDQLPQARMVDLTTCLQADIVSLHVPLDDSTRFMINDSMLSAAKRGLFLINVSRRDVVDGVALAKHLRTGQVSGYACDVLDPVRDASLVQDPDVFATPHLGAQSVDCQRVIALAILNHMLEIKAGR